MSTQKPVGELTPPLLALMHKAGLVEYRAEQSEEPRLRTSFRDLTKHPDIFHLVRREVVRAVRYAAGNDPRSPCLIGIPTTGAALATGAACADFSEPEFPKGKRRPPIVSCAMRQIRKRSGVLQGRVGETIDAEKYLYCIVDHSIDGSRSKRRTAARLCEDGFPTEVVAAMPWIILVDGEEGGIVRMREAGLTNVHVVFTLRGIIEEFRRLGFWEKETADAALAELE